MLSKEQYENIEQPAHDELYVVSHSGIGFPSANYDDLELGASGTTYTAPANGYVAIGGVTTAAGGYFEMSQGAPNFTFQGSANAVYGRGILPVRKGNFTAGYNAINIHYFRFIYAEGE